jgi:hypothetical protein
MREFQILACVDTEGVVRRKFIVIRIEEAGLGQKDAYEAGFHWDDGHWVREITDEVLAYEMRHDLGGKYTFLRLFPTKLKIVDGVIEQSPDFPADTTFRGAWVLNGEKVGHDMGAARDIHRDRMRVARMPLLAVLDTEYIRADEAGDGTRKAAIVATKQELRDVTAHPDIEAATTPDQLQQVWPDVLTA